MLRAAHRKRIFTGMQTSKGILHTWSIYILFCEKINIRAIKCLQLFRFDVKYIQILVSALVISREQRTSNGSRVAGIAKTTKKPNRSVLGVDGLCIYLRKLAYPTRLLDLEPLFGMSAST